MVPTTTTSDGEAWPAMRVLVVALVLVFGGPAGSATPSGASAEEVVASTSASTSAGIRRRQLTRCPDVLRRRRTTVGAHRFRPDAGHASRGRSFPASVRGPPVR